MSSRHTLFAIASASIAFAAGSAAEQPLGNANAACDRVRLEIVRAPCVTKGCKPTFAQQGLAGLTSP